MVKKINAAHYLYIVEKKIIPQQEMGTTMETFLTMKEVGAYLRLSTQSVKRLIADGRLAAHRLGPCSYRIPQEAVTTLLTQTQAGAIANAAGLSEKKEKE